MSAVLLLIIALVLLCLVGSCVQSHHDTVDARQRRKAEQERAARKAREAAATEALYVRCIAEQPDPAGREKM